MPYDMKKSLIKLPVDIAKKVYDIDFDGREVKLQYDSWLKDKYKKYFILKGDIFDEYKINGWRIYMEQEE